MSIQYAKYLLVFSSSQDTPASLLRQIKHCQGALDSLENDPNHYYILYVMPKFPSFIRQTPALEQHFIDEVTHAYKMLGYIGDLFNIPQDQHFLRTGWADWQAKQIATQFGIKHVIGHSEAFLKMLLWSDKFKKCLREKEKNQLKKYFSGSWKNLSHIIDLP